MSYLVLARKYRPQNFSDLTGQESIAQILKSAIARDRVGNAYLFSGTRGSGKTTSARIFAKSLNCHGLNAAGDPCDSCDSCREIMRSSSMDVLELDAASNTQVDKIREVIIDMVAFAPVRDRYKIFIIDEVHMLSTHSFNALLKTLEEPPANVVFILATTEFHKIPTTIVSRCQRFKFLPLTLDQISQRLKKIAYVENIAIEEDALFLIARYAAGSMRDGLSLLDQVISHQGRQEEQVALNAARVEQILGIIPSEFLSRFMVAVGQKNAREVLSIIDQLLKEGYDLAYFLKQLREMFRQLLLQKCEFSASQNLGAWVVDYSLERTLRSIQILSRCAEQIRWSDLPHLVFEAAAVRLCQDSLSAEELMARLGNIAATPEDKKKTDFVESSQPPASYQAAKVVEPVKIIKEDSNSIDHTEHHSQQNSNDSLTSAVMPDVASAWQRARLVIQSDKPFLYQSIKSVKEEIEGKQVKLTMQSQFSLNAVQRNKTYIEELLKKLCGQTVLLNLMQDAPDETMTSFQTVNSEDETTQNLAEEVEALPAEGQDVELAAEEKESYSEDDALDHAMKDEGAQKFLQRFKGKVSKIEKKI